MVIEHARIALKIADMVAVIVHRWLPYWFDCFAACIASLARCR